LSKRKLSLSKIREYWTSQARAHGQSPAASWSDHFAIDLEVREVLKHIRDGQLVLDAGCANGYTTVKFASQTSASFRGIDYQLRNEWGLGDIPIPALNNYLDEDRVRAALADQAELVEIVNFASTYAVGTRLLKPLLAALTGDRVDVANPGMEWNRWFSQLPAWGDYGTQKLMVLRKRP
jgi:hypothetical protein